MQAQALDGGFADAPVDAAHAFRAALTAMARPGRIARIAGTRPPAPLSVAAGTLILTLCDPEAPVHLAGGHDRPEVRAWIAFHSGAPVVPRSEAAFAVGTWDALTPLAGYRTGTAEYPDRSATLIVEMPALAAEGARLTGPGIRDSTRLSLPDRQAFVDNAALFPLGLDVFLTAGDRLAGLPRTTKVSV